MNFITKSRTWNLEHQIVFAKLSGDYNPAHIDPVESRRSVFGKVVVHGIHAVLWALEEYFAQVKTRGTIKKIKAVFRKPVGVDEQVSLSFKPTGDHTVQMNITHNMVALIDITLEWTPEEFENKNVQELHQKNSFSETEPVNVLAKDIASCRGELEIKIDLPATEGLFQALRDSIPMQQTAFLITSTRLVGMKCPGLQSIYNELDLTFKSCTAAPQTMHYAVKSFNDVFNIIQMTIDSPDAQGQIKAFVRPSFRGQLTALDIKSHIVTDEFKGQKALIIGGSRGLGAVAAKILALGGAEVLGTYAKGQKEALAIADELTKQGGKFHAAAFDVANASKSIQDILPDGFKPTHLYYFATPFIFDGVKKNFSQELFNNFCEFYISGFWRIFEQLTKDDTLKFVMYPSSSALDELPSNMFEYSLAKAAGESLCGYINKYYPKITVIYPRLPRLATDQTVSLVPVNNQNPLPVLLELLRTMDTVRK